MMKDKLTLAKAQRRLEKLEKLLEKWMQKRISNEEFAAESVIELLETKKILAALISKSME